MNLLVSTAAQKFIFDKGGKATAKLETQNIQNSSGSQELIRPFVQLGEPKESELDEYQEIEMFNQIKLYLHNSLLNLDETYRPEIDVQWSLKGKRLVIKGV